MSEPDPTPDPEPTGEPVKKSTKKTTKKKVKPTNRKGQFVKETVEPTEPAKTEPKLPDEPKPPTPAEPVDIATVVAKTIEKIDSDKKLLVELKKQYKDIDLSHLSMSEQIKTYQALTPPKKEGDEPPAGVNPMQSPAVPDNTYVPLSVRNEKKSFLARLNKFKAKGGDVLEKLGIGKKD